MQQLKFEMWLHRPEVGGIMSRFTDGKGRFTESWWSSPPSSIDHVGPEYLRNPYRHPNVKTARHIEFIKSSFKIEVVKVLKLRNAIVPTELYNEVTSDNLPFTDLEVEL